MTKISKQLKRKKQHKDYKKKNNILKQWAREQENKEIKDRNRMPVSFPKKK